MYGHMYSLNEGYINVYAYVLIQGYWITAKEEANVVYEICLEAKDETK